MSYDHKKIEKKWREKWEKDKAYVVSTEDNEREKKYVLVEFPYPSGDLHIGHWYAFSVPDIYVRYNKMKGYNVLYPFGFDSFGLPAENAAIKRNLDPKDWTYSNIESMMTQIKSIGTSFDWSRLIITSDPEYYKWTQWIFAKMFEKDLAYRAEAPVEWCPSCKTVLAHEQVVNEKCERCGEQVERKVMNQWMLRITSYADRLIDDLNDLNWPDAIKESQKNWIGRSEGAEISFNIAGKDEVISIFTTRPDTLYGATYLVLAPDHNLVDVLKPSLTNREEVEQYQEVTKTKSELDRQQSKEKTGVELKGIKGINPATLEEIPVYIADYVLSGYGTGAIMAVPAHDERDMEFAQKFDLPIREVIKDNIIINSGKYTGRDVSSELRKEISLDFGALKTTYRLRDWSIGRQRYWGCPIPIVYDPEGNPHRVPDEYLPWTLPTDVDHTPTGEPPLKRSEELKQRTENIFGKGWTPEVETMDTFVDSSWYFLRYLDPHNDKEIANREVINKWLPVDVYSGGAEHTTLHVLYSRFFFKVLSDLGLVNGKEPYTYRFNRSLILGPDGQKMSKSKGNVINPDEQVEYVGADAVRMYLAFLGAYNVVANYPFDMNGIAGTRRFLERLVKISSQEMTDVYSEELDRLLHKTIKKVGESIEKFKFNSAIASLMEFINVVESEKSLQKEQFKTFLLIVAPFAPHITEELWSQLGETESIHKMMWPLVDELKIKEGTVAIAVQINGKMRGVVELPFDSREEDVIAIAQKHDRISMYLDTKVITKVIYVKNKIINILATDEH